MTDIEIRKYLSGQTPRTHAVNPMVVHGEIQAPCMTVTANPRVTYHAPTRAGSRNV